MQRGRAGRAMAVVLVWATGAWASHAGTALVLSQTAAKLTAIDSDTHEIRGSLDLDRGPANLAVSPDGQRAYVAHSDLGQISVIDLAHWRIGAKYAIGGSPFGLAVSKSNTIYIGNWTGNEVRELDGTSGRILRSAVAGKAPGHLALTPDGTRLLAVAREADIVTIIDTETFEGRASLSVEHAPFALAVAPDGTHALVANAQSGSVSAIDISGQTVTATARVGAMPYGVAFAATGGPALVTNQQSGSVAVLPQGGAPLVPPASPNIKVGSYPEGVAITPDGTTAFVANWFSDDVSVIAIAARKEVARVKVPGGPRSLAIVAGRFGK
jgi:YVTN family beta-propeller protein